MREEGGEGELGRNEKYVEKEMEVVVEGEEGRKRTCRSRKRKSRRRRLWGRVE